MLEYTNNCHSFIANNDIGPICSIPNDVCLFDECVFNIYFVYSMPSPLTGSTISPWKLDTNSDSAVTSFHSFA